MVLAISNIFLEVIIYHVVNFQATLQLLCNVSYEIANIFIIFYFFLSHWNIHIELSIKFVVLDSTWNEATTVFFQRDWKMCNSACQGTFRRKGKVKKTLYNILKILSWKIKDINIFCLSIHNANIDYMTMWCCQFILKFSIKNHPWTECRLGEHRP